MLNRIRMNDITTRVIGKVCTQIVHAGLFRFKLYELRHLNSAIIRFNAIFSRANIYKNPRKI
jgi:hypothetical protein